MKHKKAFTLIELLAVIVIIGVLAIISSFFVTGIISKTKSNAFERSVVNTEEAGYNFLANQILYGDASNDTCYIFDYSNDVDTITFVESKDGKNYYKAPVESMSVKNDNFTEGNITVCTDSRKSILSNGELTYSGEEIVDGNLGGNDTTPPVINGVSYSNTSKSITAIVSASEYDYGKIKKYYFSLDGVNYIESDSNTHTFSLLTSDTEYTVYVKVSNESLMETLYNSKTRTTLITPPIYNVNPSGYSTSKVVTITYPNGYTKEYSLDSGTTWLPYTTALIFNANGSVIARVSDGTNYVNGSSYTVTNIDTTAPTAPTITGGSTTYASSRTITISGVTESGSGINRYEYYLSSNSTLPTLATAGTTNGTSTTKIFNTNYAGYYVYFRAVDNVGNVGNWSTAQRLYIDINNPTIVASTDLLNISSNYTFGSQVALLGYNFKVLSDNGTYIKLLSDANQFAASKHVTNTSGVYRWSTSAINSFLNTTVYNSLSAESKELILATSICNDTSGASSKGGFTQKEIISNGYTCTSGYTTSNIRLLTQLEYNSTKASIGAGDTSWLYGSGAGYWWTMTASTANSYSTQFIGIDGIVGNSSGYDTSNNLYLSGVRPVIELKKSTAIVFVGESNVIATKYFTVNKNGNAAISGTACIDTSNSNVAVTNTSELAIGTHVISCTTTKITGKNATTTKTIVVKNDPNACTYDLGKTWNFAYTGGVQSFTVPCSGTYKLETWGAQGGTSGFGTGGRGGYSTGLAALTTSNILYVQAGSTAGYNGGGTACSTGYGSYAGATGGGATHIGLANGLLSTLSSNKGSILIVAGGGGGGANSYSSDAIGGVGGGTSGTSGSILGSGGGSAGTSGSQATAGTINGSFGQGGAATCSKITWTYNSASKTNYGNSGGGGGGYYGGGGASATGTNQGSSTTYSHRAGSGGGGSGYLSSSLTSSSMTSGTNSGNGKATITLISLN